MDKTVYFLDMDCPDFEGMTVLFVTPESYWNKHKCQADFTEPGVFNELEKNGFWCAELMEGTLEVKENDVLNLILFLDEHPDFINNSNFSNFIRECSEE